MTLRAFQAELARKLAAAGERGPSADGMGVVLHGVRAWVPLVQVAEVLTPQPLQRVPRTQPWVLGVAHLCGSVGLVVDWVRCLGLVSNPAEPALPQDPGHWLVLASGLGVNAALRVDRLLGLFNPENWRPVLPLPPLHPAVPQVWHDAAGAVWYRLDLQQLAQSPDFLNPHQPPPTRSADA